ncbi:hypothetical protein N7532_000365 [Penicillium argentinense]|uniref:Vacuolar import and degradation protein 21 n=1 Tax=Penicillium argentinense TaxID=1131581 RepID=A0A9W9KN76_9EURO|nr:uncharacterized protein N7532_000365 [Penicillium argentinense]KAJ5112320.1 hypothetical protein N7532_000365 [Penicillium argentinense]
MLRDELLRSKNDEIANCLLSRKRKLTELYYATVGFEGATGDTLYQQKERAFLDANDLSKGRYFDETTLPSPTHTRARSPGRKAVASTAVSDTNTQQATGITPPPTADGHVLPIPTQSSPKGVAVVTRPEATTTGVVSTVKSVADVTESSTSATTSQAPREANSLTESVSSRPSVVNSKVGASALETPLSSQDHDGAEITASSGAAKLAATSATPSLEIPHNTHARKKPDSRPSLTLGPSHSDQPLSPVSSVDPYSNNTPVPVAASPDTSPGEEVPDAGKIGRPSPKHNRTMSRAGLVPSTPDEQLRLEEAQSLQQNTEYSVNGAGGPLTKEVIEERVGPVADKDQMEVDQDATSESRQNASYGDGTASAGRGQLSPTERLQQAAQTLGDTAAEVSSTKKPVSIPPTQPSHSQPERMTTRVSSGAIRHKSVSEILGEASRTFAHDKPHSTGEHQSPDSVARMRFKDRKDREKERTRVSTVVFPKQTPSQQDKSELMDLIHSESGDAVAKLNEEKDYLFTLFLNRAYAPPRGAHLNTLLASAHKTLSTSNHLLEYQEQMDCRSLRRIYGLQNANRWPLRQMKRSMEPPRPGTHLDVLLDHMKWMRTDFREERKWKLAAAKSCADWCAEYVNSDDEHRTRLRVNAKIPTPTSAPQGASSKMGVASPSEDTGDEILTVSHATPDLVPSAEEDSVSDGFNDEPRHDIRDTVAPAAIFSLGSDEFNFSLEMNPIAEKLLDELPLYEPLRISPQTQLPDFKRPPDSVWKTDILPVSKFATTKITFHDNEHPRKRSRYDYSQYRSDPEVRLMDLPPEQDNVALFRPENKHIRDRIHPGHSFRPPTEHPMPSVGFFESRQSSQWTMAEDDELRRLVKEYSYNWSLISKCLSSPSLFTSGAERRTPWECFERWVGLEGLPADMSKTQYFRAYHQRLETAQRTVLAQQQAAQQQQQQQANNGQAQQPIRRRTTQPLRVDRRRSSRHLALLDGMRKLAKKRETMLQKQQHASHLASLRKANEANQPKPPISSPAEFSRLKYDREMKMQERQEQYRQQMIAQQRASLAAQRAGQLPNQQQSSQQAQMMNNQGRAPNNMPPNPGNSGISNGTPNGVSNGMAPGVGVNQGRAQPMQGMPNGGTPVNNQMPANAMAMKMMPQNQMQQPVGARPGMPMQASPDNARVIREANRLQEQQRLLQSRQQQQVPHQAGQSQQAQQQFHNQQFGPQGSHSPNLNMPNVNGTPNNPAMMAALQAQGGMQSPSFHGGTPQGVSTPSPRMGQPNPLSSGVVPTISTFQSQIQRANPHMPAEQVNKLATDRLNQYQQQRMSQQAAMNAAAGGMNNVQNNYQVPHDGNFQTPQQPGVPNNNSAMQVPQNQGFSPMMRVPQANQQNRVNVTSSPAMNGAVPQTSRSATPQTQRSGSAQAGAVQGSSKSPHPPAAQPTSS